MQRYEIRVIRDAEADVFVAESDDVPGLITEAVSHDELLQKLRVMVPELLELNDPSSRRGSIELVLHYEERLTLPAAAA